MRIGYLSRHDPHDRRSWSGIHSCIVSAIGNVCSVISLGPMKTRNSQYGKIVRSICRLYGMEYLHTHSRFAARGYAECAERKLRMCDVDLILAVNARAEVAFLRTHLPIVYVSDATFANLVDFYPRFTRLIPSSFRDGWSMEKRTLGKVAAAIFSSEWAARSAICDYNMNPSNIFVAPFGPAVPTCHSKDLLSTRTMGQRCRLLLVGVDWCRKGGHIALETLLYLYNNGMDVELTVCGCSPPTNVSHPRLTITPYQDKNRPKAIEFLQHLYLRSHFLILPSRADCTPLVVSEACSYGLPVIATRVGGITDIVREDINGILLDSAAGAQEYAAVIADIWSKPARYRMMSVASRMEYERRLNWEIWSKTATEVFKKLCEKGKTE